MKFRLLFFASMAVLLPCFFVPANALEPADILSETAVLMDADTGQVLFEKNMNRQMHPASTTKIMTGLLVAENADMQETVVVSREAIDAITWDSSHIALSPGEELTVSDAMYATMLASANDAANALAEHVSGTMGDFSELMTKRAHEMGAVNTQFANPNGLTDKGHYTTAYDLALITRFAAQNQTFMTYFGGTTYTMPPTNIQPEERPLSNYQYMLLPESRFYAKEVVGGKVGFTNEAKHTMSTVAQRDGRTLVCVVMRSNTRYQKFYDTEKLLEYGFDSFYKIDIAPERAGSFASKIVENGVVAGSATFDFPAGISVLLHKSLKLEDISLETNIPEQVESRSPLQYTTTFSAPSVDGSYPILNEIPLQSTVTNLLPEAVPTAASPKQPIGQRLSSLFEYLPFVALVLCGTLLAGTGLVLWRLAAIKRQRRLRYQRLKNRNRGYARL